VSQIDLNLRIPDGVGHSSTMSSAYAVPQHNLLLGNPYKLYVNHSRINVRKHFFACRLVNVWNSLKLDSDDFRSLHSFRSSLNNIDFSRFLIIE